MRKLSPLLWVLSCCASLPAVALATPLDDCLSRADLVRVARVVEPSGRTVFARVTEQIEGHIKRARAVAPNNTPLAEVFERALATDGLPSSNDFSATDEQVCAVVDLPEAAIDAETQVIVSTGLNYAAHAEEAGGGDVFLFPKPAAPSAPFAPVHPPAGVTLLDYEVELAFVLLGDVDPQDPPPINVLLEKTAFFLSNDISDREPIIRHAALSGPSTGFPEGKGQRGFFPTGPWMVRGSELFAALEACGEPGLALQLWVDDEEQPRQSSTTERMILKPGELVARIGTWTQEHGRRSTMPFLREGDSAPRFYPFAVPEGSPKLTSGSIVQTGTPDGVALNAPSPLGVALRGALRLRSPFEQFLAEEKARFAAGATRYLAPGSTVRARIDGLGVQEFVIGEPGGQPQTHACDGVNR